MRFWLLALFLIVHGEVARADGIRMGVSFAQDAWVDCVQLPWFTPFEAYVLIEGGPPITGWEMSVQFEGNGGQLSVLSAICHPSTALCWEPMNWITGLGACLDFGELGTLATMTLAWFSFEPFEDAIFCARGAIPSSFAGAPGVSDCEDQLRVATIANVGDQGAPVGCAVINPSGGCTPLPVRSLSISSLKGRFD